MSARGFRGALRGEFIKAGTLPAVWVGLVVSVLGTAVVAVLNSVQSLAAIRAGDAGGYGSSSVVETAFAGAPLGAVGAVVIGVILVSSEYSANSPDAGGGRQITTTRIALPGAAGIVLAKVAVVLAVVFAAAVLSAVACLSVAYMLLGDAATETDAYASMASRAAGSGLYWMLTGLLASGITLITRNGTIPLLVLILNSSVVSVSLLLTNVTSLAHWLPDMAGRRLFGFEEGSVVPGGLDTLPGALVMAAWSVLALVVGGVLFARRDA